LNITGGTVLKEKQKIIWENKNKQPGGGRGRESAALKRKKKGTILKKGTSKVSENDDEKTAGP